MTCLTKDADALLSFYDFPAEHWDHLSDLLSSERRDLLEILEDRHGRSATIVTSQLPVEH